MASIEQCALLGDGVHDRTSRSTAGASDSLRKRSVVAIADYPSRLCVLRFPNRRTGPWISLLDEYGALRMNKLDPKTLCFVTYGTLNAIAKRRIFFASNIPAHGNAPLFQTPLSVLSFQLFGSSGSMMSLALTSFTDQANATDCYSIRS